jgi:Transglutaminase-like superfamily
VSDLDFWRTPGPLTGLDDQRDWLADLPDDPAVLRALIPGLIVHPAWAGAYGVAVDDRGEAETQLRPASRIVDAIREHSGAPPTVARPPTDRAVGTCRNFTVLHVALLRSKGYAARARCGHAGYFEKGKWVDHWVTEWWDEDSGRWVRADPQLDDLQIGATGVDWSPDDLPDDAFLAGGECWQRVRKGEIDPNACGIFDLWGSWFVRSNVVRDLAAVNKMELLPWDSWGLALDLTVVDSDADNATVDALAAVCTGGDLSELRAMYHDERFRVPSTVTSFLKSGPIEVELGIPT